MTLAAIRAAIAESIKGHGNPALNAYDYAPASVVAPAAIVEPEVVDWRARPGATFRRGTEVWTLSVFVLLAPVSAELDARALDAFFDRSAEDLKDAIENAEGIDGSVEVTTGDRFGEYPVAGQTFAGFRLVVEVLA